MIYLLERRNEIDHKFILALDRDSELEEHLRNFPSILKEIHIIDKKSLKNVDYPLN